VSAMLSRIPVPPMPEQLTQRLQGVIAQEAARRSAGATMPAVSEVKPGVGIEPCPAMIPGRPDLPPPERTRRRRVRRPSMKAWSSPSLLRGLTAAAVLVVLVGGGFVLTTGRGPVSRSTAGTPSTPKSVRNRPSSAIVGSAAATPLHYRHGKRLAYANAVTSRVNYTKASLPAGVRSEVKNSAQVTGSSPEAVEGNSAPSASGRLSGVTISHLESCLSSVATGNLVLLVDIAHYLGRPATIIVLKPVNDIFDVIVVGQGCGTSGKNVITRLTVPKR